MTIAEALQGGRETLAAGGIAEPGREAASLLSYATGRDKAFIVAHPEYILLTDEKERFHAAAGRRAAREPFQYITGKQEFYGLDFTVAPDVLIPRPETEILVEAAIEHLKASGRKRFCEIGIGSGCISVSILANVPEATAVAGDISENALKLASLNAETNGVIDRLQLIRSDTFDKLPVEQFDLVASNPPYVPEHDFAGLPVEVRDHEPPTALTDGGDGLSIIRTIITQAPSYLLPAGLLLMEIGWNQSERVAALLDNKVWTSITFLPDLQGIPRILKAIRRVAR